MHIVGFSFRKATRAHTTEDGQVIEFENGAIQVDAEDIAAGLRLTPDEVMQGFRTGAITSVCEKALEEDTGRHRLTFYSSSRRLRLTVDAAGAILKRSSADFTRDMFGLPLKRGQDGARQTLTPVPPTGDTK